MSPAGTAIDLACTAACAIAAAWVIHVTVTETARFIRAIRRLGVTTSCPYCVGIPGTRCTCPEQCGEQSCQAGRHEPREIGDDVIDEFGRPGSDWEFERDLAEMLNRETGPA